MQPEVIADYIDETGEGPLWHPIEKKLYWGGRAPERAGSVLSDSIRAIRRAMR